MPYVPAPVIEKLYFTEDSMELSLSVQRALLGQVPPSLRFIRASISSETLRFVAVLDEQATESHIDALSCAVAEVVSDFPSIALDESIEINPEASWKHPEDCELMYLRYGELSEI